MCVIENYIFLAAALLDLVPNFRHSLVAGFADRDLNVYLITAISYYTWEKYMCTLTYDKNIIRLISYQYNFLTRASSNFLTSELNALYLLF